MTPSLGGWGAHTLLIVFVLFCRIGACMMIAPGVSNSQIPTQVRLFVALGVTLALSPLLIDLAAFRHLDDDPIGMTRIIVMEALIGGMIGLLGRMFFAALETLAAVSSNMLGLSNPFGVEYDAGQAEAPIATLVILGATTLLFTSDAHWQIIRGLVSSYDAIAPSSDFDTAYMIRHLGDVLSQSFVAAIRVASPFFLYSVIVNFALSLISRVTPQIQVFFVAPPFVIGGGLWLLYFVIKTEVSQFLQAFAAWLSWS